MLQGRIKHGGKVFRDPIHQLIRIDPEDEFILDLIDTPEFQRLRRIRQLGVSWLTYPGAEHSRFVHSLGVFNFVQRMLHSLRRRYSGDAVGEYLEKNGRLVKAAALLHDIGHGPFSHLIERAFRTTVSHESKTVSLIKSSESQINEVLRRHHIDADAVADLIQHTSPHSLLTDLVSSQLDADRMDYLLRDSYCTGVQYGLYDAEWLINAMCVGRNPRETNGGEPYQGWRLALDERRGEKAAEQFTLARSHMNEQVYYHRVTRGFEALLLNLFEHAAKTAKSGRLPSSTPDVVQRFFADAGELKTKDWLRFDESTMVAALHGWVSDEGTNQDPLLSSWSQAFLNRKRIFGCVGIGNLKALETPRFFSSLREAGLEEGQHWCTDAVDASVYKGLLSASRTSGNDEEEGQVESILLSSGNPDRKAKPIETRSSLMSHLDNQRSSFSRLYFDSTKRNDIERLIKPFKLNIESTGDHA